MKKITKISIKALKSVLAFGSAFFIVNIICFFYYNPLHNTELNDYRLEPNTYGVYAVEGLGILRSDENGFPNNGADLAEDDYILVMGSSHSAADQVLRKYRYSDILNNEYSQDGATYVYNVAHGGKRFQHIIKNFKDIITEFPNSSVIIIELSDGTISMSEEEFQDAMQQVEYVDSIHGKELHNHSLVGEAATAIKKYCPFILLMYDQLTRKSFTDVNDVFFHADLAVGGLEAAVEETTEQNNGISEHIYEQYFQGLRLIRGEYSGELIVIYHEPLAVEELQTGKCSNTTTEVALLEKACNENDIDFINVKQDFLNEYMESSRLPYGFHNTEMGKGHLNKTGHKIIAGRLIEELQEYKSEYINN